MSKTPERLAMIATPVLLAHLVMIFLFTPEAQPEAGALAQKIFYFHVPAAYAMYLSGTVCFLGSLLYLAAPSEKRNALAAAGADAALLFGLLVLTSGPLWAKKAWGVYWAWEPRLVTSLLSFLIYAAIVMVRRFSGEGAAERKFAATIGVLAWFNLWIIHYAVQKWGGVHPSVMGQRGGGLADPMMRVSFFYGFLSMTLVAVVLIWLRHRDYVLADRTVALEQRAYELDLPGY